MDPDQGKKIRINRYVGISLAKLRLDCRTLTYPQPFSPFCSKRRCSSRSSARRVGRSTSRIRLRSCSTRSAIVATATITSSVLSSAFSDGHTSVMSIFVTKAVGSPMLCTQSYNPFGTMSQMDRLDDTLTGRSAEILLDTGILILALHSASQTASTLAVKLVSSPDVAVSPQ